LCRALSIPSPVKTGRLHTALPRPTPAAFPHTTPPPPPHPGVGGAGAAFRRRINAVVTVRDVGLAVTVLPTHFPSPPPPHCGCLLYLARHARSYRAPQPHTTTCHTHTPHTSHGLATWAGPATAGTPPQLRTPAHHTPVRLYPHHLPPPHHLAAKATLPRSPGCAGFWAATCLAALSLKRADAGPARWHGRPTPPPVLTTDPLPGPYLWTLPPPPPSRSLFLSRFVPSRAPTHSFGTRSVCHLTRYSDSEHLPVSLRPTLPRTIF